ncbi:immunoglobulin superfamily member 3-like isoform X1 [Chiloscyllium punctatum]|uniref:immunoglobulin superfamily member 3-like isoform X1 n=1 Tax=Chiloscyllium punctatum TaxID=137246 RepID=UPI003B63243E
MFLQKFFVLSLMLSVAVGQDTRTVLIQSPEAVTVPEGGTVTFRCDLRSSNVDYTVDKYTVNWHHSRHGPIILSHFNDGGVYRSDRRYSERFQLSRNVSSNSFILTIRELQLRDTNTYICEIWGTVFGKGTRLNVTSANVPVLLQSPSLERVTEGHTARLQCTMKNAAVTHTDVHWYWEQPGKTMQWGLTHDTRNITRQSIGFPERFQSSRDSSNETFILTITNAQPNDTGVYYCKVWGDISGNGSQLTVTDPLADPVLIQDPVVSKVAEGETVEFQCAMIIASVIDTDVHWHYQRPGSNREWVISHFVNGTLTKAYGFHDRVQLSRNIHRNSYILSLVNVTRNDTAVYSCSVWGYIFGAGSQLNVAGKSMGGNNVTEITHLGKTKLVWFILGALFGITGVVLFIGYTCLRKKQSSTSQSGAADDPDTTADYENVRTLQNSQDFPEDSNATYTTLQPTDQSVYSDLKGKK